VQAESQEANEPDQSDCLDARWRAIKLLVEKLLGGKVDLQHIDRTVRPCSSIPAATIDNATNNPDRFGWGLEYNYNATNYEAEQTSYTAQGTITTADGKTITLDLNVAMNRELNQQISLSIKAGDAAIDPLMISFDGSSVELTNARYAFDLDVDGSTEYIPFARTGNAFLALDLNHDGEINSGQELFGPTSGDGFAELEKYDLDHNR
jgi:hypothetical protein